MSYSRHMQGLAYRLICVAALLPALVHAEPPDEDDIEGAMSGYSSLDRAKHRLDASTAAAYADDCGHVFQVSSQGLYDGKYAVRKVDECTVQNFDQVCTPDNFDCVAETERCQTGCAPGCVDCQAACAASCTDCKRGCKPGDRKCIERRCAGPRLQCRLACLGKLDACRARCQKRQLACWKRGKAQTKRLCPDCEALGPCLYDQEEAHKPAAECLARAKHKNDPRCAKWCYTQ